MNYVTQVAYHSPDQALRYVLDRNAAVPLLTILYIGAAGDLQLAIGKHDPKECPRIFSVETV